MYQNHDLEMVRYTQSYLTTGIMILTAPHIERSNSVPIVLGAIYAKYLNK